MLMSVYEKGVRSFQQTHSYWSIWTLVAGSIARDERVEILNHGGTVPVEKSRPRFRDLQLARHIRCVQLLPILGRRNFQCLAAGA